MHSALRFTAVEGKLDSADPALSLTPDWSRYAVLFILILSFGHALAFSPSHRDTITVDGVPLALELEVSQVPSSALDPNKKARNLSRRGPDLVLGVGSGMVWPSIQAMFWI